MSMSRIDKDAFWRWAHSDFLSNAERGLLAEYIVTRATNSASTARREWDAYDVVTEDEIKVEVKASGYVQTWNQSKPSTIRFNISERIAWHAETNTYDDAPTRSADVYVFCVHHEEDRHQVDPLDTAQWTFYVISTKALNAALGKQKTVGLAKLRDIGATKVSFEDLAASIRAGSQE
jgi:hypothetical protein